jgi:molybdopterin/thiamine biosynthesis adenylyltransferase
MENTCHTDHVERPVRTASIGDVEALIISAQEKLAQARTCARDAELIFTEAACNRAMEAVRHALALISKGV